VHDDEAAIRALVIAYCERLDRADFDGVAQLFAHGAFRSPRGTNLVGVDAVRSQYDAMIVYPDGTPRTKHVLGTVIVDVDAERAAATARCAFTVFQDAPGVPLQPVLSGRYHDTFARVDGEWWFTERMVLPDLWGDLRGHMNTST
jgi:ketosteroid isomerase-like protein